MKPFSYTSLVVFAMALALLSCAKPEDVRQAIEAGSSQMVQGAFMIYMKKGDKVEKEWAGVYCDRDGVIELPSLSPLAPLAGETYRRLPKSDILAILNVTTGDLKILTRHGGTTEQMEKIQAESEWYRKLAETSRKENRDVELEATIAVCMRSDEMKAEFPAKELRMLCEVATEFGKAAEETARCD